MLFLGLFPVGAVKGRAQKREVRSQPVLAFGRFKPATGSQVGWWFDPVESAGVGEARKGSS